MTTPIWTTPTGLLATINELEFITLNLSATGNNVKYSIVNGALPTGLELSSLGTISGSARSVSGIVRSEFTVRARSFPYYSDRTFYIDVSGLDEINWLTDSGYLNLGYNREQYLLNKQWVDINVVANLDEGSLVYTLLDGSLPPGLTLSTSGKISGFVNVLFTVNNDPELYEFTVNVSNGVSSKSREFKILVANPNMLRADSDLFDWTSEIFYADNIRSSVSYLQPLQFLNGSNLGQITASSNFVNIPVTAYDPAPARGPVTYKLRVGNLPDGLQLNEQLGYLQGAVRRTPNFDTDYQIVISATKFDIESGASVVTENLFNISLKGQSQSQLSWVTSANLGTIEKGFISELAIQAQELNSAEGIKYKLIEGELPVGLTLQWNGIITGRVSYNSDIRSYSFTVRATNKYGRIRINRTFTLAVIWPDLTRYTDVYVRPFLPLTKRTDYYNFITDERIFTPSLMYRHNDTNFGIQYNLKMILEFGLEQLYYEEYFYPLMENFYKKRLRLGKVKVAIAKDPSGKHVYDIVYADVVDELVNNQGVSANSVVYLNNQNEIYYPASIDNMRGQLQSITLVDSTYIQVKEELRPKFMQPGQSGYIKIVPICYTLPGKSTTIIRRIESSGFKFNTIDFEIDRLIFEDTLDNTKTKYLRFDRQALGDVTTTDEYIHGPEGWIRLDDESDQPLLRE
jgi:hypothetical protein